MSNLDALRMQVATFPQSPGVYLMEGEGGEVLYVGKAKSLKKRVQSYLRVQNTAKVELLMSQVHNIMYIVTKNDYEALLLEHNVIKERSPKYNILLRDDKTFPMITITKEEYPRVLKTRTLHKDGGEYFGPYIEVGLLNTYLELIDKNFALRKCNKIRTRTHPCLYYHLGRCTAICAGLTSKKEYLDRVKKIRSLLTGRTKTLKKNLTLQMHAYARKKEYEQAAQCRDVLSSIESIEREQVMIDQSQEYRNVVGVYIRNNTCCMVVVHIKEGRVIDQHAHYLPTFDSFQDTFEQFLLSYYHDKALFPQIILLPQKIDKEITAYFQSHDTLAILPQSPSDIALMRFAKENAKYGLQQHIQKLGNSHAVSALQKALGLSAPPMHIEGFDIATIEGKHTNAAMVYFYNGVPDTSKYRHFNIKSLPEGHINDFQSIEEAISRRYTRLKNEKKQLPQLIVVDGGIGQVNSAKKILDDLSLSVPVIGLAKKHEEIFFPESLNRSKKTNKVRPNPLQLPLDDPASQLLQAIRNEAHRFATTFRARKQKSTLIESEYTQITGIGPKKAQEITQLFPNTQAITDISADTLANMLKVSLQVAKNVQDFCLKKHQNSRI